MLLFALLYTMGSIITLQSDDSKIRWAADGLELTANGQVLTLRNAGADVCTTETCLNTIFGLVSALTRENVELRARLDILERSVALPPSIPPPLAPPEPSPPPPSPPPPAPPPSPQPTQPPPTTPIVYGRTPEITPNRAWFQMGTFDLVAGRWQNAVPGGSPASIGGTGASRVTASGNGAAATMVALAGGTSTTVSFGDIIADTFTICTIARYSGSQKGRIFDGTDSNWLHGFHGADAGVCHYNSWVTPASGDVVTPDTNWVWMCGANGGDGYGSKLANGVDRTSGTGGTTTNGVAINAGAARTQPSDFEVVEVMTWNYALADAEMSLVMSYMETVLGGRAASSG